MKKNKLIEMREYRGYSQQYIADKLGMDVSTYHRRESGQVDISPSEWKKLAKNLDVPLDEIYESDEKQVFICTDSASPNHLGTNIETNHFYTIPERLLKNQDKYIAKLEEEIVALKRLINQK